MLEAARRKPSRTEEKSGLLASDLSTPSSDAASQRPLSTVSPATTRADAQLLMQETVNPSPSMRTTRRSIGSSKGKREVSRQRTGAGSRGVPWCTSSSRRPCRRSTASATCTSHIDGEKDAPASQVDSSVTPVYAGFHMAATKTGHATGVVLFSVYAYSAKCFKKPLLIGRAVSFLAFGLYLCIMLFPAPARRYVFLIAFFFQSFAEGSSIVLRAYVPRVSSKTDRQAAYGVVSGAMMFSILGGPLIQMAASAPPDWKRLHWLEFINYTYCIYLALLLGIVATVIICTKLTEPAPIKDADEESFSEKMATALTELRSMDKVLMAFLFFERIVTSVTFSALLGAFIPYMQMIVHGDHTKNTLFISGSQACAGATSITAVGLIIFSPAKKIRSSCILFISLTCYAFLYLYSYPWAPISEPITVWSEANPHACNTTQLEWCAQQSHVKLWYWLPPICLLFGLAVPTAMISIDTVYSKMLGNIDQNLMQGALELVNDLASAIAPVITLKIYTDHGPATFWLVLSGVAIVGFLFWLPMIPKMRRLKM